MSESSRRSILRLIISPVRVDRAFFIFNNQREARKATKALRELEKATKEGGELHK